MKEFTEEVEVEARSELKKTVSLQSSEALKMSETSVTYYSGKCSPFGIKCENYSSLTKLVRVTALVNRFINKLKKSNSIKGPLTISELNEAENMWIVYIQRKNFCDMYEAIVSKKSNNLQNQLGDGENIGEAVFENNVVDSVNDDGVTDQVFDDGEGSGMR